MNSFTTGAGLCAAAAAGLWLYRRSGRRTHPHAEAPGGSKHLDTRILEAGAAILQDKSPLRAMNLYLDGFHFYSDDMGGQMEAHHYCTRVDEDLTQCVIFDGNTRDARLIGIEYIISERLFRTLPEDEKRLWHSHHYEVKSGTLVAPQLPLSAEHRLMQKIITTYGKTWHTWDTRRDALPLGIPRLMMGFTADGQIDPVLVADRDRRFGVSTQRRRDNRRDIPMPHVDPAANSWQYGETYQTQIARRPLPGNVL